MRPSTVRVHDQIPDNVLHHLLQRDAALWIGPVEADDPARVETLVQLVNLPWRLVLCEPTSAALAQRLDQESRRTSDRTKDRGYLSVIAGNPAVIQLPPSSLPVFFLNGREDAKERDESPSAGRISSAARRTNSLMRLLEEHPRLVVLLVNSLADVLVEFNELWQAENLRTELVIITETLDLPATVQAWQSESPERPSFIDVFAAPADALGRKLSDAFKAVAPDHGLNIKLRRDDRHFDVVEVTDCELPDYPILDRYELIQARDVRPLLPSELPEFEMNRFFDKSTQSWLPYSAGLPWKRYPRAESTLLSEMQKALDLGPEANRVFTLVSESGAGGTTLARQLAHCVATSGFPTLVAKQAQFHPDMTEVSRFMLRVRQKLIAIQDSAPKHSAANPDALFFADIPWLVVFDVQHWQSREQDLLAFMRALGSEGRTAIILTVVDSPVPEILQKCTNIAGDTLTHELGRDQALELGQHLNGFLQKFKKDRSPEEWESFWNSHTPRVGSFGASTASFWIALDFWLKRQLDLGQSIQSWLFDQFRTANLSPGVRRLLLQIASFSIERLGLPQALLPTAPPGEYPYSHTLSEARLEIPALGLVYSTTATSRFWGIAHGLLARYLINSTARDRPLLRELGLDSTTDSVELRLALLREIITRPALAHRSLRDYALEMATSVFKLDREGGNFEFFKHWRVVLEILEEMPQSLWDTSRTFNHHVAVSRRRLAVDRDTFGLTAEERRDQLTYAIEDLEFALTEIPRSEGDERNLNLLNSLARAYQDLADVELELNASAERLRELREKASAAARAAYEEDPSNSFVLETIARELVRVGQLDPTLRIQNACLALGHLFQATSLDSAPLRQERLRELISHALSLLSTTEAEVEIGKLCNEGNPFGFMARACALLGTQLSECAGESMAALTPETLDAALDIIEQAAPKALSWALLKLEYDLLSARYPREFSRQLDLLDALEGTEYRPTLQEQLERAILLHQVGRHQEANEAFYRFRRRLWDTDVLVRVPERLRTLIDPASGRPRVCHARVVEEAMGYRAKAQIDDLAGVKVPFIPQDWGVRRKPLGERFACKVILGPKGPIAKPAD